MRSTAHRVRPGFPGASPAWGILLALLAGCAGGPERVMLWRDGIRDFELDVPDNDPAAARLAAATLQRHLDAFYGPLVACGERKAAVRIVAGTPRNNPMLSSLVRDGAAITRRDLGDEGFQLLTHRAGGARYVIVHGRTPVALKHGIQELIFYRIAATPAGGVLEWPLDVTAVPAIPYRGIYMLPCWSAHDALTTWETVLQFNSEIALNRTWFWLDGFPVAGHPGEYAGTPLADAGNVQRLIDLVRDEGMKFLIGGGWMNFHHGQAVGQDFDRARSYYLDYLKTFRGFHGLYFEPTGEGKETARWALEGAALTGTIGEILGERPDFEIAVAIGKFNNPEYLRRMASFDPARVFWWWCWGDPWRDRAKDYYPSITRWHLSESMSEFHGSMAPPGPADRELSGVVTSYDPGQGYGNTWNGWGKLGCDQARDFHPHTVPYFARQYEFRERCWDPEMTEEAFVARLQRRLFDADAPADAGRRYRELSHLALETTHNRAPTPEALAPIRACVEALKSRPRTPRTQDTVRRMEEALAPLAAMAERGWVKRKRRPLQAPETPHDPK